VLAAFPAVHFAPALVGGLLLVHPESTATAAAEAKPKARLHCCTWLAWRPCLHAQGKDASRLIGSNAVLDMCWQLQSA
jgi:hypothetical protein